MIAATDIFGVRVNSGESPAIVGHIEACLRKGDAIRVAFLNAHLSNVCARDAFVRDRMKEFLVLNDGVGVDIARRILYGARFPENLNGTDFVPTLLSTIALDLKIYLLGATGEVVARAASELGRRWPRHRVVGFHHGYLAKSDERNLAKEIMLLRPDVVLVGMGNPKQETWIADNVPKHCRCAIAVGAWFDFVAGKAPRAPLWIRRVRLEWTFRLLLEPRRLSRRYLLGNLLFLARLVRVRAKARLA